MNLFDYFKYLFCVCFLTTMTYICSYKHCCQTEVHSLVCTGCIPNDVPDGISEVEVFAIEFANYSDRLNFQGMNWNSVQKLVIIPEETSNGSTVGNTHQRFTLKKETFVNLTNLVSLRFSSVRMNKMENGAFEGISNLEILDLRGCHDISLEDITTGIEGSHLPKLRTLILKNISRLSAGVNSFGGRFFSALSSTKLEYIDFSSIIGSHMDSERFSRAFPYLQSFNFEYGEHLAVDFLESCFKYGNGPTFDNLRKINANFPEVPPAGQTQANDDLLMESSFAHNFTEVRARGFTPNSFNSAKIVGTRLNSSVRVGLEFLGGKLKWDGFDLFVDDNDAIALETLDIGENSLEYFDRSISSLAKYLKHFDISFNHFSVVDVASFEAMLHNMTKLEIFNCSHNGLKQIPKNLFTYSKHFKVIDLSHNLIENLNIKITHLPDLEILDLKSNKIQFLSNDVIYNYEFIFIAKINTKLNINISMNPYECSCHSKDFVRWLSSVGRDSVFYNEHGFVCHLGKEKEIPVNDDAVAEVEYLCILPYVIISVSVGAGMFAFAVVAIIVYCLRRHREKKRKENLRQCIELFKLDRNLNRGAKKFPVFLSYSSSDSDVVENHVLSVLNKNLQRLLETEERCVATGDTCFTPGFHVTEEMANCLESCSVLVACVSNNFCQSIFCKEELLAANHDKVPIILLFLEKVDVKQLPKSIQKHFKTTTRAKLTMTDTDGATFIPSIETICEGIAKLISIKGRPGVGSLLRKRNIKKDKVALSQGRYRWRHDSVLRQLAHHIDLERRKKLPAKSKVTFIPFVKKGQEANATPSSSRLGVLATAQSWEMKVDLEKKLQFPHVVQTTLRLDIVVRSSHGKKIVAIELTVPWEERCDEAYESKASKYAGLMEECRRKGWSTWLFPVEVGCRGFPAASAWKMFPALGITGRDRKTAIQAVSNAAEKRQAGFGSVGTTRAGFGYQHTLT